MIWLKGLQAFLVGMFLLLTAVYAIYPDEFNVTAGSPLPPTLDSGTTSTSSTSTSTTTTSLPTSTSSPPAEEPAPTETTVGTTASDAIEQSTATLDLYESPPPTERTLPTFESPSPPSGESEDFWWRLAACESGNGTMSDNQFQFMGGTEDKVGYYPGASYGEQRDMAIWWADQLRAEGTHPGSSAGWPECWWIAGGG